MKIIKKIMCLLVLFCLFGCSSDVKVGESIEPKENETKTYIYDFPNEIDFYELRSSIFDERKEIYNDKNEFDECSTYYDQIKESSATISQDDLYMALETSDDYEKVLSLDEAVKEVELLFRILRYGYGAYYYFGGDEQFELIKNKIIASLEDNMSTESYLKVLKESFAECVRDGHFSIGKGPEGRVLNINAHPYYYYSDMYFDIDEENKFYLLSQGVKWYYVSCCDKARIVPTLLEDGRLVYNLMIYSPEIPDYKLILTDGKSERIESNINWTRAAMSSTGFEDKKELTDDYYMVNILGPNTDHNLSNLDPFINSKNILFDNRGNGGRSLNNIPRLMEDFFPSVIGESYSYKIYNVERENALFRDLPIGGERVIQVRNDGKLIENDNKNIFILVNKDNGSNGEDFEYIFKSYSNTAVIGVNTGGSEICGNVKQFYLPYSKIPVTFGISLKFYETVSNLDGIGIEPDIWCDPSISLTATENLIKRLNSN